jgi:hypothetical protein
MSCRACCFFAQPAENPTALCENERTLSGQLLHSPYYYFALGLLCGGVGFRIGWRGGTRWALPVMQGLLGFLAFATAWRMTDPLVATLAVAAWAVGGGVIGVLNCLRQPEEIDRRVLFAHRYREEMQDWLRSGRGSLARPRIMLRTHVVELLIYVAAALVSANFLALIICAVFINRMSVCVATLLATARRRWTARLLALNSWSLIRIASYILIGSACAAPLATLAGYPAWQGTIVRMELAGALGVLLSVVLELLFSRSHGRALARAVDLGSGWPNRWSRE